MRAAEQIRRASDELAAMFVDGITVASPGSMGPKFADVFRDRLADALNNYGRAIAFLAEEEKDAGHVGASVPDLQSDTPRL